MIKRNNNAESNTFVFIYLICRIVKITQYTLEPKQGIANGLQKVLFKTASDKIIVRQNALSCKYEFVKISCFMQKFGTILDESMKQKVKKVR